MQSLESGVVALSWFLKQDKPQTWELVGSMSGLMETRTV